jgi:hypothetical protein
MRNMPTLQGVLEMSATTVPAEPNATLHICKRDLQDVLNDRSNLTLFVSSSCIVRGLLTYAFPFNAPHRKPPAKQTIANVVKKEETTGSVLDMYAGGKPLM